MSKQTLQKAKVITADELKAKHESEFLTEVLAGMKRWKNKGEKEYAEAYRVLLNKFTQVDMPGTE